MKFLREKYIDLTVLEKQKYIKIIKDKFDISEIDIYKNKYIEVDTNDTIQKLTNFILDLI